MDLAIFQSIIILPGNLGHFLELGLLLIILVLQKGFFLTIAWPEAGSLSCAEPWVLLEHLVREKSRGLVIPERGRRFA